MFSSPQKYNGLVDLKNSPSNYHSYGHGSFGSLSLGGAGSSCFALNICPDLLLAAVAAGGAAAVYLLYTAITVKAGRKKRSFTLFDSFEFWEAVNYGRPLLSLRKENFYFHSTLLLHTNHSLSSNSAH